MAYIRLISSKCCLIGLRRPRRERLCPALGPGASCASILSDIADSKQLQQKETFTQRYVVGSCELALGKQFLYIGSSQGRSVSNGTVATERSVLAPNDFITTHPIPDRIGPWNHSDFDRLALRSDQSENASRIGRNFFRRNRGSFFLPKSGRREEKVCLLLLSAAPPRHQSAVSHVRLPAYLRTSQGADYSLTAD